MQLASIARGSRWMSVIGFVIPEHVVACCAAVLLEEKGVVMLSESHDDRAD